MYVRHDVPSKEVNTIEIKGNTEGIFVELNFRKSKRLLIAAYKPSDVSRGKRAVQAQFWHPMECVECLECLECVTSLVTKVTQRVFCFQASM